MAAPQLTSDIPSQGYGFLSSDPSAFSYLALHPLLSLLSSSASDQFKQLFMGSYCWEIRSGFQKSSMSKHICPRQGHWGSLKGSLGSPSLPSASIPEGTPKLDQQAVLNKHVLTPTMPPEPLSL